MRMTRLAHNHAVGTVALTLLMVSLGAQASAQAPRPAAPPVVTPSPVTVPADYVIGVGDVLTISVWKEPDLTGDVVVRPDGKITLPLMNDIDASGLTPEALRMKVTTAAERFLKGPTVNVIVKTINSRNVYITGQVAKQGAVPLLGPMTVLQLISTAGGVLEFAKKKNIVIIRNENGRDRTIKFNLDEVVQGKNPNQNIQLKSGDSIYVP